MEAALRAYAKELHRFREIGVMYSQPLAELLTELERAILADKELS